jgi:hypothetical protein
MAETEEAGGAERGTTTSESLGGSYQGSVELGGGRRIELGGIAWSETGPFALINGRVMGPGESVEGWVLERIEPRRVELRGPEGTLYLTLR